VDSSPESGIYPNTKNEHGYKRDGDDKLVSCCRGLGPSFFKEKRNVGGGAGRNCVAPVVVLGGLAECKKVGGKRSMSVRVGGLFPGGEKYAIIRG